MKNWYYVDSMEVYGPFDKEQIAEKFEKDEISGENYFWCSGMKAWNNLELADIENLNETIKSESMMPSISEINSLGGIKLIDDKDAVEYDTGTVFLKISGILFIVIGIFNIILGIIYIAYPGMAITNGINMITGIAIIFIGCGIMKINKAAYNWGLLTSGFGLVSLIIAYFQNDDIEIVYIFCIFIFYSLTRYKKLFK